MKIGIIGSGNMGRVLGLRWQEAGHHVFFGSRNAKAIDYIQQNSKTPIKHGTIADAVEFGDVLLYSLRDTLPSSLGIPAHVWKDKIVIDCNNGEVPADFRYPAVQWSFTQKYQEDIPMAKVVKAFNTVPQELLNHDPDFLKNYSLVNFIAGDDTRAKETVSELVEQIGLKPVDIGLAQQSILLESLANLVRLLIVQKQYGSYFSLTTLFLPEASQKPFGIRQASNYK